MMRFLPWALLTASLAANVALGLMSMRDPGGKLPDQPLVFSKVQLDPEQRERIVSLRSELLARREETQTALQQLRGKLAAEMAREPEDRLAVTSTLAQIAQSQARFQQAVVDHVLAVRAVLRPDQRPAFQSVVAGQVQGSGQGHCVLAPPQDAVGP